MHVSFVYVIYWSTGGDVVTPTPPRLLIWQSLETLWVMTTWGSATGVQWVAAGDAAEQPTKPDKELSTPG